MRTLTLPTLKLGLRDLLDKRRVDLLKSDAGKYYEPRLSVVLAGIEALPVSLTGGVPFATELQQADEEHDAFGSTLYYTVEACLRLPDLDPDLFAAAARIRDAFVPALSDLMATYAVEADNATDRKPKLQELKDDLKRFPLPDKRTLFDVAKKYIEAGEHLGTLLSQRADIPQTGRKDAAQLRSRAVGHLFRLRKDLTEEVDSNNKLPRDLEHRVFGYFDTLESMQAKASRTNAPSPEPATPSGEPPK